MWKRKIRLFFFPEEKIQEELDCIREKLVIQFHNTVRLYHRQYKHHEECIHYGCDKTITLRSKKLLKDIECDLNEQIRFLKVYDIFAKETDHLPKHPECYIEVVK